MVGNEIKYKTRDGKEFDGYLTKPDTDKPLPGIIIITAIFGNDEDMIELSDAWASDGFIVSVPDIFWRVLPGPTTDHAVGRDRMGKFDLEQGMKDIEDVIADLKNRSECNGKIGMLGYCFGGLVSWLSACRVVGVSAASCYYGGGIAKQLDGAPRCPVMMHFGALDAMIPLSDVDQIRTAQSDVTVHVYENADHGFNCDHRGSYHQSSAEVALDRTLEFFSKHVG